MFTGLIESVGTLTQVDWVEGGGYFTVATDALGLETTALGDSIAIDGACTTVVALGKTENGVPTFSFDASPETLSKTVFQQYQPGTRVNLERPLLPSSRLGGHFVSGHVDGTVTVLEKYPEGLSWVYGFQLTDPALSPYLITKGSVAVHGISLTVNTVEADRFSVAIIPHTLSHTNLGDFHVGDRLHVETDLLGKYVHRFLSAYASNGLIVPSAEDTLLSLKQETPLTS